METLYNHTQNMIKLIIDDKLSAIYYVDLFNVMRLKHNAVLLC